MSDEYKAFVRNFRKACFDRGMSVDEVAAALGVSRNSIYNWWAFRSIMDGDTLLRIVDFVYGGKQC